MTPYDNGPGAFASGTGGYDLLASYHTPENTKFTVDYKRDENGLQSVSIPMARVIAKLSRKFAITPAHAKAAAELNGWGGRA